LTTLPGGDRARFFQMPRIGISSTMVRRRVRAGLPIRYFVPDPVLDYIERQGLYRTDAPVAAIPRAAP
jgi:nicotinate-nucleotide adenylyltransferase